MTLLVVLLLAMVTNNAMAEDIIRTQLAVGNNDNTRRAEDTVDIVSREEDWTTITADDFQEDETNDDDENGTQSSGPTKYILKQVVFKPGEAVRFYVKFTVKKPVDKYLYLSFVVRLDTGDALNFIYWMNAGHISGSDRLYPWFGYESCSGPGLANSLPVPQFDHTMIADIGSPNMYKTITLDGTSNSNDFSTCEGYATYLTRGLDAASSATLEITPYPKEDILDYIELKYKNEVYSMA